MKNVDQGGEAEFPGGWKASNIWNEAPTATRERGPMTADGPAQRSPTEKRRQGGENRGRRERQPEG